MVSRKAAEMMSSTHEKMSGLGESLRILGEVDGRSNAKA